MFIYYMYLDLNYTIINEFTKYIIYFIITSLLYIKVSFNSNKLSLYQGWDKYVFVYVCVYVYKCTY